jgi:ABC-2 type transport system ATP-binding protein
LFLRRDWGCCLPQSEDVGSPAPFLQFEDLSVALGGRSVLNSLNGSFSGRAIGLLGPNGAGKSTLLRTILGFHEPSGGTLRVLGLDIRSDIRKIRHLVGYMPENDAYVSSMTAIRYLRMIAELAGLPRRAALERAHHTLFYVGLGEARHRKLGTYSLGMRQLIKLAVAIVHGPKVVILDEPTNALDPAGRHRMLRLVQEIRETGKIHLIISSHLLPDIEECCDEVVILRNGEIISHCNLAGAQSSNRKFLQLEASGDLEPFLQAACRLGCDAAIDAKAQRIKVVMPEHVDIRHVYELADEHGIEIRRMDFKRDSLQDIFMKAMAHGRL